MSVNLLVEQTVNNRVKILRALVTHDYTSFILSMSIVGLRGMSLGCTNTTIRSGIVQVLHECEALLCKKNIFIPTQSQTIIAVVVGHEVNRCISLRDVDRDQHQGLTRAVLCNRCNERHNKQSDTHTSPGNASKTTHRCLAWCILG